jgi:formate hydrogenlyase subunit 3/multisubunit Na+/H+ antiporter MnhD subunit
MLASILSGPLVIAALHATTVRTIYLVNPLLAFTASLWVGSAAATIQDCVLPRMRGTAGAIFILALSMLGLALGPYSIGKVAALTGSLRTGLLSLLGMMPVAILLLWVAMRRIEVAEKTSSARAQAAGEEQRRDL